VTSRRAPEARRPIYDNPHYDNPHQAVAPAALGGLLLRATRSPPLPTHLEPAVDAGSAMP